MNILKNYINNIETAMDTLENLKIDLENKDLIHTDVAKERAINIFKEFCLSKKEDLQCCHAEEFAEYFVSNFWRDK